MYIHKLFSTYTALQKVRFPVKPYIYPSGIRTRAFRSWGGSDATETRHQGTNTYIDFNECYICIENYWKSCLAFLKTLLGNQMSTANFLRLPCGVGNEG
jgi:hypothetical protein